MSSERGNTQRQRAQKHQNRTAFKNNLHDTSKKSQIINNITADGCCARCREVIEWRIKYKKYKPLTQAKKCIKCQQKTVKKAYCTVCVPCAQKLNICVKCAKTEELSLPHQLSEDEMVRNQARLEAELKLLPERKRRTFMRLQASGQLSGVAAGGEASGSADGANTDDSCSENSDRYDDDYDADCDDDDDDLVKISTGLTLTDSNIDTSTQSEMGKSNTTEADGVL